MTWSVTHPVLYFLPLFLCLLLHIFLSAGFLLGIRQGFFRGFIYMLSCLYLLGYLLIFNHGMTLTSTKIQVDVHGGYVKYENHYGIVRIPLEEIQAVCVEGGGAKPLTIWIQSERQVFYLDHHFKKHNEFLPLIQSILKLGHPQLEGELTVYRIGNFTGLLNLEPDNNVLRGHFSYYLPWLGIFPLIAYFLAARAWQGSVRSFQLLAVIYSLPMLGLGLLFPPTFFLAVALILYPLYPVFLSAMCLPDSKRE